MKYRGAVRFTLRKLGSSKPGATAVLLTQYKFAEGIRNGSGDSDTIFMGSTNYQKHNLAAVVRGGPPPCSGK